ncbi:bacteriophage holin [Haladaptatus sp. DFWS20]|uniref:bacteriophage holin n=1 Tax=Haladaptatus sp. DFWS20 TaxID=3403467 RepID=UPI003EB70BF9
MAPNFILLVVASLSITSETLRLDSWAFGWACGLLWAGSVVVLGLTARVGWGKRWERLLADVYRGYNETTAGLALGAVWGFFDAFIGGYTFALLYNRLRQ